MANTATYDQMDEAGKQKMAMRVIFAALAGTAIEFYDFFIYGTAAALIFRDQFFPNLSPMIGQAVSIATFAVGYVSRPLGAAILSNFGDKYGRKNMMILSMMTMGIATFLIGVLPSAATIGVAAPILLILLRLIQGFGVGAEQGGALVIATEYAPKGKRGLYSGLAGCGIATGLLIANIAFLTLNLVAGPEFVKAGGWRIPFWFSLVLVGVGLWFRINVEETPAFRAMAQRERPKRIPFLELFTKHWVRLGQIIMLTFLTSTVGYVGLVLVVAYATSVLKVPSSTLLTGGIVANCIEIPATILLAWWGDSIGRRKMFLFWVGCGVFFAWAVFPLVNTGTAVGIICALAGLRLITAGMYGSQGAIFSESFDTEVRFSGVAVGFAISNMLSAFLLSAIFAGAGSDTFLPAVVMSAAGVITFVVGLTLRDMRARDMTVKQAA